MRHENDHREGYPKLNSDITQKFKAYLNFCSDTNKLGDILLGGYQDKNDQT